MCDKHVEWSEAFEEEIPLIKKRRCSSAVVSDKAIKESLVGLAFSGGGIRSATFGLGVLEGLRLLGLLPQIDYLSTVSGGGYIGAWLSANCKRAAQRKGASPSWLTQEADWKPSVDHLRRYSNYLSPTVGFFSADTWSMGAIWLRNTILVQITVILAIAVLLLLPRPLYEVFGYWPHSGSWRWTTIIFFILGAIGIGGNHLRVTFQRDVGFLQARRWLSGLILAVIFFSLAVGLKTFYGLNFFSNEEVSWLPTSVVSILLIAGGFCLQPVAVKLVHAAWRGPDPPAQVNYNQAWVQGLIVLPMMAVGFLVGAILWGESQPGGHRPGVGGLSTLSTFSEFFLNAWRYWPFPLSIVVISLWLFSFCSIRDNRDWRCVLAALLSPVPAAMALYGLLCGIMVLLHSWVSKGAAGPWLAYTLAPAMVLYAFSLAIVVLIGMLGRQSPEGVREWWSRFGAWLAIYGFGWMLISSATIYGPLLSAVLFQESTWKWGASIGGGWIGTTLAGLWAGNSSTTGKSSAKSTRSRLLELFAGIAPFVFIAGLLVAVSTVLHLFIVSNSNLSWVHVADLQRCHWEYMERAHPGVIYSVIAGSVAALLLLAARVDINEFGLNAFYRNRLVRCYLGATRFEPDERNPQNFTGFDDADDLALASLKGESDLPGPFHIVNCALNLGGSKDLALHTRHSAAFTLTPLRCGSRYLSRDQTGKAMELGYSATAEFGGTTGQPTLGQAVAVSGAAASPNMGYHTSPVVAFLLTLFNVRLGWWFPNPGSLAIGNPSPAFSLRYLITELFGGANDRSAYVAISDGGHFENLGAYELIKRKCSVVIISDAECDPNLRFEGLGTLIRMCDVDFGAKINIDVNSIRTLDSDWSSRRCSVGTIEYGDGFTGTLIYLKAAMTGKEATDILQYKSAHPAFPHESTGNQFYAEDQFESYRNLGRDIAMRTFEPASPDLDFNAKACALRQIWSSSSADADRFTKQSARLSALWSKLGQSENLQFLDKELTEGWPEAPLAGFRSSFYLCSEMFQLMENVYLELRLEDTWNDPDNAGWRTLFKRWACSPALQEAWRLSSGNYGLRFQYFWNRRVRV